MTLMNIEQLDLGDQPPPVDGPGRPVRINPLVWVAIAVAALVGGFLVLGGRGAPTPDRLPTPTPTLAQPTRSPGPNERQYLGVTRICGPITDGRRRLAISFQVSNVSPVPVTVDSVMAILPLRGLRQLGPAARGGSCDLAGTRPMAGVIPAGRSDFYTLTFALPKTCPAGYPVQVRIDYGAAGFAETSLSILYSDLSVPDFDTCTARRR
jgi:hypothetical protein